MINFKEELRKEVEKSLEVIDKADKEVPVIMTNNCFTKKSLICNIMYSNPDTWRDFMKENYPSIIIKEDGDNAIFNYSIGADFSDPVVREARGIIINTKFYKVVCWPFTKFCKYDEPYHDEIDWSFAFAEEKIDGSIIKLWYDDIDRKDWVFSTNGTIYAENAPLGNMTNLTFMDAIKDAVNYYLLETMLDELKTDCTYIFELVGIQNQVVIKYERPMLYHIGTRSNITGQEFDVDLGIIQPNRQAVGSLDFCINYVSNIVNTSDKGKITGCDSEGLVVVDKDFHRIKIKSPIYMILHNLVNNGETSKKLLIQLIHEKKIDIDSVCEQFPNLSHWIRYYAYKYDELMYQINSFVNISRQLYVESTYNRKLVATRIKGHKYSSIAFKALDNDDKVEDIMDNMTGGIIHVLCKLIPNYEPDNYGYLFG